MDIICKEKFEDILKEELETFDLDPSLVEIIWLSGSNLPPLLPYADLNEHSEFRVKLQVVVPEGKVTNMDEWFKSCEFKYYIALENLSEWESSTESITIASIDCGKGTIKSIAIRIRDIFKSVPGQ